jgi:hypothetical protein
VRGRPGPRAFKSRQLSPHCCPETPTGADPRVAIDPSSTCSLAADVRTSRNNDVPQGWRRATIAAGRVKSRLNWPNRVGCYRIKS